MIVTNIKELKKQSSPVESVEEAREIISKLEEEMKKHNTAVGLSAIQIGIPKRISIINTKAGKFTLINPVTAELIDKFIFWVKVVYHFQNNTVILIDTLV